MKIPEETRQCDSELEKHKFTEEVGKTNKVLVLVIIGLSSSFSGDRENGTTKRIESILCPKRRPRPLLFYLTRNRRRTTDS